MCYSAQVYSDYRKYQRYGGTLDIKAFADLFFEQGQKGTFTKLVPKAVRDSFEAAATEGEREVHAAVVQAYRNVILHYEEIIAEQTERLIKANAKLSIKHTKTAENDARVAGNKIADAEIRIAQTGHERPGGQSHQYRQRPAQPARCQQPGRPGIQVRSDQL